MSERRPDIRTVTAADLVRLEPLLRASFGRDDFELGDELGAFAEHSPPDWFALYDGLPQGFIRYFQADENLYLGELYVVPGPERARQLEHLLRHFAHHHKLPVPATLRLDVLAADDELMRVLASLSPTARTKTFADYQLRTSSRYVAISAEQMTEGDLRTVQAILTQLKRYGLEELERLSHVGQLYVHKNEGVKAALHAAPYGHAGHEVVTLATVPTHYRLGYASALLQTFLDANPNTTLPWASKLKTPPPSACTSAPALPAKLAKQRFGGIFSYLEAAHNPSRHPHTSSTRRSRRRRPVVGAVA